MRLVPVVLQAQLQFMRGLFDVLHGCDAVAAEVMIRVLQAFVRLAETPSRREFPDAAHVAQRQRARLSEMQRQRRDDEVPEPRER